MSVEKPTGLVDAPLENSAIKATRPKTSKATPAKTVLVRRCWGGVLDCSTSVILIAMGLLSACIFLQLEEARDEDDGIASAPGLVFDSVALVVDEATEAGNHQPEQVQEQPGPSRSAVEEFIIFESCVPVIR